MKKIILFLACLFTFQISNAQSYYDRKGQAEYICDEPYTLSYTDGFSVWYKNWQYCKYTVWFTEYYSGYVYVWNGYDWISCYKQGYYWTYTWYSTTTEVY